MRKEIIVTAKTVEQAVEIGAYELKMEKDNVTFEVLELPKKGFLGLGAAEAKVKVIGEMAAVDIAVGFLDKIIKHMQLDAAVKIIEEGEKEIKMEIVGQNLGSLIGYHGEILDSLQYLTYLAVNKGEDSEDIAEKKKSGAIKISIDVENYRAKREETLKGLAKKMAERVQKYGRSVTLEPMNAYERRIIHATIQDIEGVTTHSIGQDNERKIIISKENKDRTERTFKPYNDSFSSKKPRYENRYEK